MEPVNIMQDRKPKDGNETLGVPETVPKKF